MEDKIRINGGGLKCDNPECDFVDMSIAIEDYKDWVNAPCPECGANLLTEKDYNVVLALQQLAVVAEKFSKIPGFQKMGEAFCKNMGIKIDAQAKLTARFDGTGKINLDLETTEDENE